MSKKNGRMVYRNADGTWSNKRVGATRAASNHRTQAEAEATAKAMLKKAGGGELTVKAVDGKIRSKDTIAPGNDPRSVKDTEH